MAPVFRRFAGRPLIVFIWLALLALLFARDFFIRDIDPREQQILARGRQETYMGVYFNKERIGYLRTRLIPETDTIQVEQEGILRLQILGKEHPLRLSGTARLSPSFTLQDFDFSLSSPFYSMQSTGRVQGNTIYFSMDSGKGLINDSIKLARPPFFMTNQRSHLLQQGLEKGDKVRQAGFDPLTLATQEMVITYQGRDKVLIKGRVHNLHHFQELVSGIRINFWLDESGKVIKEESPAGFVFLAEPKFQALDISGAEDDLLASVAVDYQGRLPDLARTSRIRYRLALPTGADFDLAGGRQEFDGSVVTLHNEGLTGRGGCTDPQQYLAATSTIQSTAAPIRKLADEIIGSRSETVAKVKALAAWVYNNLEKRPVIGLPDALTALQSGRGDCNEHAVLFAALARAVNIPCRIAAGVMLHEGRFFYHAWNEVCTTQGWLSVDSSRNQLPADLSHIRFVVGEGSEQVRMGSLLGNLGIIVLSSEEER